MEVKEYLQEAEDSMQMAVEYLDDTLSHIRAGKASARLLDGIRVDYYGSAAPISNVANVSVPDARTIAITPWEKSMFKEIEKAIINSDLGVTPENNGEVIRICIPPLTEERRKQLVKQSKSEAEMLRCLYATLVAKLSMVSRKRLRTVLAKTWKKMPKATFRNFTTNI